MNTNPRILGMATGALAGALVGNYVVYPMWLKRQTVEYAAGDARVALGITLGSSLVMAGIGWISAPPIARRIKAANQRASQRSNAVYYGS